MASADPEARFLSALTAGFLLAGLAGARADGPSRRANRPAWGCRSEACSARRWSHRAPGAVGPRPAPGAGRRAGPGGLVRRRPGDLRRRLRQAPELPATSTASASAPTPPRWSSRWRPKAHVTAVDVYRKGKVDRAAVADALHWAREHARTSTPSSWPSRPPRSSTPWPPDSPRARRPAGGRSGASERVAKELADGWAQAPGRHRRAGRRRYGRRGPGRRPRPRARSRCSASPACPRSITVGAADRDGVPPASAGGTVRLRAGQARPRRPRRASPGSSPTSRPWPGSSTSAARTGRPRRSTCPSPPPAAGRALVGSTIPAAAAVAAVAAQLHRDGVADGATRCGASSPPPPSRCPASRSGARAPAACAEAPRGDLARQRPAGAPAPPTSAPNPPPASPGRRDVTVLGGASGRPGRGRLHRAHHHRRGRQAGGRHGRRRRGPARRPVVAGDADRRAAVPPAGRQPLGRRAPGAATSTSRSPASVDVVEDVPLCLVEGLSLTAFNFYIHDMPAEDLTFALLPALPPGLGLLDGPLMVLPLNPLHEPLLAGVSGPDGLVHFPNVPPAYFVMRQFSDYGAPVAEDSRRPAAASPPGRPGTSARRSYLNFDALVLPNPCAERIQDHWPTGTRCHQAWLEQRFGSGPVALRPHHRPLPGDHPGRGDGHRLRLHQEVAGHRRHQPLRRPAGPRRPRRTARPSPLDGRPPAGARRPRPRSCPRPGRSSRPAPPATPKGPWPPTRASTPSTSRRRWSGPAPTPSPSPPRTTGARWRSTSATRSTTRSWPSSSPSAKEVRTAVLTPQGELPGSTQRCNQARRST